MEITEVRIKLIEEPGERLKAFCSVTFDNCFVVRDLKIIEGSSGPFVAMPSRKLTSHCPKCRTKNHLRAQHCNQCGSSLPSSRATVDTDGRAKLYADIAHPINSACREQIQRHVLEEFDEEKERAKQPGYVSRYDDFDVEYSSPPAEAETTNTEQETRVDQAHQKPIPHPPSPGGASQPPSAENPSPIPAPKADSASRPAKSEGDFGAGIFPGGE